MRNRPTVKLEIDGENYGKASFKSENEEIVVVDELGLVTAKKEGETKVIVTDESGQVSEECKIKVDTETVDMLNNIIKKSKMRLFCRLKFCEIGAFLYIFI